MASPVRLLHSVQEVLVLLHFAILVFQEVSVNSFPVTPILMAIQAVTGLSVLVRRPVAAKILSQCGAEKHRRNIISVLVELLRTLD